jgi:hypothetical protein
MAKENRDDSYLGNRLLKPTNVPQQFTKEEVEEYVKCRDDIIYFLKNYVQVIHVDHGLIPFDLYDYQQDLIKTLEEHRYVIVKSARQSGKSVTSLGYILHYILFNKTKIVGMLANKASTSRELLGRLQTAYQHLPKFLQQGIVEWNKGNLELENGSKIIASSTSSSAIRGYSFSLLFLDEFAFVQRTIADAFIKSVYPTISSGKDTKIIMVSTPNGYNLFYKFWNDAVEGNNQFKTFKIHWTSIPERDQEWRKKIISDIGEEAFRQEYEADFLGSSNTLISYEKLQELSYSSPIWSKEDLDVYEEPEMGRTYVITVDTARGQGLDYSTFTVFDSTEVPYKIAAKYRNNTVAPLLFPNIINNIGKKYNDAYILVESNDIGAQVADVLHHDLEYENLLTVSWYGRHGQQLSSGHRKDIAYGVRTTKNVKKIGCSNLKSLIEEDKLIITDYDIISELTTYVTNGDTFAAEDGSNDDLVTTLVLFGWVVDQQYFKELSNQNIREKLYQSKMDTIDDMTIPFGIIDDGLDDKYELMPDGGVWQKVDTFTK